MLPRTRASMRGTVKPDAFANANDRLHTPTARGRGRCSRVVSMGRTNTPTNAQTEGQGSEIKVER